MARPYPRVEARSVQQLRGVGDQDPTCPNGSRECAKPGTLPCFACLADEDVETGRGGVGSEGGGSA